MMSDVGLYDIMFLRDLINLVCVDCAANSREVPACVPGCGEVESVSAQMCSWDIFRSFHQPGRYSDSQCR